MRTTCRLFFASRSLIHAMPCSCGSHIRGQRSELQVMVPFSMDVRSEGKPSPTHPAIVASFHKNLEHVDALRHRTPVLDDVLLERRHELVAELRGERTGVRHERGGEQAVAHEDRRRRS